MGKKLKNSDWFWLTSGKNAVGYMLYYERLMEIAVSMFKWEGVDEGIDTRFMEYCLFAQGQGLVFDLQTANSDINGIQFTRVTLMHPLDIYSNPTVRKPFASNGFDFGKYNEKNSVIVWNNFARTPSMMTIEWYAQRLYEIDVSIDINAKAQRTPVVLYCDENTKESFEQAYADISNGKPVVVVDKNLFKEGRSIGSLNTSAPYVAGQLYQLRTQIWNEALTYLGVTNSDSDKKERQNNEEIHQRNGGTIASRFTRLAAREDACNRVNSMFGTKWKCTYRDVDTSIPALPKQKEEENNG